VSLGALAAPAPGKLPDDPEEPPEGVVAVVGGVPEGTVAVGGVTGCVEGHAVVLETRAAKPEVFPAESKAPTAIVYAVPQESLFTVSWLDLVVSCSVPFTTTWYPATLELSLDALQLSLMAVLEEKTTVSPVGVDGALVSRFADATC